MFENISGLTEAAKMSPEKKLKIAIIGEPKTGKSWFASTAPAPVFVADFDDRAESLRGRENVFIKTYKDLDPNNPNAIADLETDLQLMIYQKKQGKEVPKTIVLDSLTYMRAAIESALMATSSNLSRSVRIGGKIVKIPQGWDIVNGIRRHMDNIITTCSSIGNVIITCHEQPEKDTVASTKDEKKYTGRITIQPQYLNTILSTFNEVWRISIDDKGEYTVEVKPTNEFLSSTTLKLDATEKPNISEMLKKHNATISVEKK